MKHIFKILRISFVYFALASFAYTFSGASLLDSISTALYQNGGTRIDATIEHKQLDSDWTDNITIELVDSTKFAIIATEQLMKVDADTIFTYIPSTNQIVIDYYYPNEFSLLSMLSGNFAQINIGDIQKRSHDTIIDFTIHQSESRGKIWVNTRTYYPIKILMEDELDNTMTIKINSIKSISSQSKFPNYINEQWEVIDLRE